MDAFGGRGKVFRVKAPTLLEVEQPQPTSPQMAVQKEELFQTQVLKLGFKGLVWFSIKCFVDLRALEMSKERSVHQGGNAANLKRQNSPTRSSALVS